jgi:hypothetical protein
MVLAVVIYQLKRQLFNQIVPSSVRSLVVGCLVNYWMSVRGFTKRYRRLSWLTNSALVYEPKCRGMGGGGWLRGLSQWVQLCTWRPNKFWRSMMSVQEFVVHSRATVLLFKRVYNVLFPQFEENFPRRASVNTLYKYMHAPHYQLFVCIKTGESCRE